MVTKTYWDYPTSFSSSLRLFRGSLTTSPYAVVDRTSKTAQQEQVEGWRDGLRKREDVCSPRSLLSKKWVFSPCKFEVQYTTYGYTSTIYAEGAHMLKPGLDPVKSDWTADRAAGRAKAIAKVNQAHHSTQFGVFAGEILQTLNMLRHPLEALRSGYKNYFDAIDARTKKVSIRGINQRSKRENLQSMVADTYLEYKFGWVPLHEDVKGIITALDRLLTQHRVTRADSKYRATYESPILREIRSIGGNLKCEEERKRQTSYILSTKCALKPAVDHDFQTQFGMDLPSFAPTLWELLPWSFVIDYFANVQQLLNAAFTVRSEVVYVSQTEIIRTKAVNRIKLLGLDRTVDTSGYSVLHDRAGSLTGESVSLTRACAFGFPPFSVGMPSRGQIINLAALIASHNRSTWALRG